jgi:hypothetical protein
MIVNGTAVAHAYAVTDTFSDHGPGPSYGVLLSSGSRQATSHAVFQPEKLKHELGAGDRKKVNSVRIGAELIADCCRGTSSERGCPMTAAQKRKSGLGWVALAL